MAKKKLVNEPVSIEDPVAALRNTLSTGLGVGSVSMSSHSALVGIAIPSLAVQWLLGTNVLPLSRMMEITGAPECCKSTFMYEVMRWFLDAGGNVVLFETEAKDNAALRHGVFANDADRISRVTAVPVTKYETWVKGVGAAAACYKKLFASGTPQLPVLLCVDSLVAAPTEKMLTEVEKDGHTSADFPRLPKALSNDLRTFADMQDGQPFMFSFTNHIKQAINSGLGVQEDYRLGGRGVAYHETFSIKLSPAAKESRFTRANVTGRRLKMSTMKNAIGPRRDIEIVLYFRTVDNPYYDSESDMSEKYVLQVDFDWGEVDMRFLASILSGNRPGFSSEKRAALMSLLDLNIVSKQNSSTFVWSRVLDIPESDPVSFSEAGRILLNSAPLVRSVQDELGIKRSPAYHAGIDFRQMLEDCIREQERLITVKPVINNSISFEGVKDE